MAIIGIDLGTTNSLVTVWEHGEAKIIPNKLGSELTPSVVSIENGEILVGQLAKDRLLTHPDVTVGCFKRYMGTNKVFKLAIENLFHRKRKNIVIVSDQHPLTPEEIKERRKRMKQLNFVDTEENQAVIAMASRIYAESVGKMRERAEYLLYSFQSVLKTNSPIKIKKARENIMKILKDMEDYMDRDVFEEVSYEDYELEEDWECEEEE